ncbi:SH3 domain-containing protein [Pseudomonas sp.]|uniref:SH3 domain-containing protein n=1 Tax=Pseudomonas sp. TaxID=306 RepID=UPI002735A378|nr:SH3 domain-containing protein [Pseudomonas sp.]MDP3815214.1 SH3 domain-containing protein [Pseudomonas sp.]
MNRTLMAGLAALLLSLYSSPGLTEQRQAQTVQETELRAEPSAGASALGKLSKQATVMVVGRQGGWYQVQTAGGQRGWLPLLSLRFAKDAQASRSSNLGGLLSLGSQAAPASGVATGVRGISDEQLQIGGAGLSASLQYLESFAAQPGEARSFAQQGGLHSQSLPYAR